MALSMALSMTNETVQAFARANQGAMLFLHIATDDYAVARCSLLNGLLAGLVSGAQAVEKYLKAFILFANPGQGVRRFSHSLSGLAAEAEPTVQNAGGSLAQFTSLITRLEQHYAGRYPDNPGASTHQSTSELEELDHLVIYLNEHMPIPPEVKYRSGFYAQAVAFENRGEPRPTEFWLRNNNKAVAAIMQDMEANYLAVFEHLYPGAKS